MSKRILIKKHGVPRAYGLEYDVYYLKDGRVVHKTVLFGGDLKYADLAYTKEFEGVKPERLSAKKLKRLL